MDSNNNSANMKLSPGVKALIIGYISTPANVGKVVILERKVSGRDGKGRKIDLWSVSGDNLAYVYRNSDGEVVKQGAGKKSHALPQHLMPIRPEEDPLEITDVITKKEKA